MKELSIEEKARRYDEALKVAKNNYETIVQMDNDCTFAKDGIVNTFHHMFPELKENEDERIRKALIDFVKSRLAGFSDCKRFTDWLERQGEQNLIMAKSPQLGEQKPAWSEEDELSCFESALFTAFSDAWQSYLLQSKVNVKQWAKEHSKELLEAAKEEFRKNEQTPAWSEEDKHRINDTIYFLETAKKHYASTVELDACIDWLKSLKDRVGCEANCTTTKEWSEEDEKFVHGLIRGLSAKRDIHGHTTFSSDGIDITKTIDWLKSLKDRVGNFDDGYKVGFSAAKHNQWKPSDEQIKALEMALYTNMSRNDERYSVLSEFVAELKKLREEDV